MCFRTKTLGFIYKTVVKFLRASGFFSTSPVLKSTNLKTFELLALRETLYDIWTSGTVWRKKSKRDITLCTEMPRYPLLSCLCVRMCVLWLQQLLLSPVCRFNTLTSHSVLISLSSTHCSMTVSKASFNVFCGSDGQILTLGAFIGSFSVILLSACSSALLYSETRLIPEDPFSHHFLIQEVYTETFLQYKSVLWIWSIRNILIAFTWVTFWNNYTFRSSFTTSYFLFYLNNSLVKKKASEFNWGLWSGVAAVSQILRERCMLQLNSAIINRRSWWRINATLDGNKSCDIAKVWWNNTTMNTKC